MLRSKFFLLLPSGKHLLAYRGAEVKADGDDDDDDDDADDDDVDDDDDDDDGRRRAPSWAVSQYREASHLRRCRRRGGHGHRHH